MPTSMRVENPVVVGLLWHSMASGNLGVIALTISQMAILEQAAVDAGVPIEIRVFGWQLDGAMQPPPGFERVPYFGGDARALLNPLSAFRRALSECALVLDVGEGDSFSDIYGIKRLLYLCSSKYLAGRRRRRLILSPQTLGPFASPLAEKLAGGALGSASKVFARDPISYQWAEARVSDGKLVEAIDMAFCLPFESRPKVADTLQIGLNISGLLYFGGYGGGNSLKLSLDFATLSHRIVEWALALPDSEVWLIPHVVSRDIPEEDDLAAVRTLQARYPDLKCAGPFSGPSEAKSFMSTLDFFAGGRMHACIGAFSAGVPIAPLAYSRKFNGLFASLGYSALVDCKVLSTDDAFASVLDAFDQRGALATEVQQGLQSAHRKLQPYRDTLVQALQELVA